MARYTGPTSRIARRFGEPIFGPDKVLAKKAYAPDFQVSVSSLFMVESYSASAERQFFFFVLLFLHFGKIFSGED